MQGLVLPVHLYQLEEYSGGNVATSLVAYVPFRLLGPTLFALKLAALAFALASSALYLAFAWRTGGARRAAILAVLTIAAPPLVQKFHVIHYGNHADLNLLLAASLLLVAAILRQRRPSFGLLAGLGVLAGFSLYFDYAYAVLLVVLSLVWMAWNGRWTRLRIVAGFTPGFAVGLAPWFAYHLTPDFPRALAAMFVREENFPSAQAPELNNAWDTVVRAFGGEAAYRETSSWTAALYLGVAVALVLFFLWERRREAWRWVRLYLTHPRNWTRPGPDAERPVAVDLVPVAYVVLFVAAEEALRHTLPDAELRPRYLAAVWPMAILVLATAIDLLWERRKAVAVAAVVLLSVPCIAESAKIIGQRPASEVLRGRGYTYDDFFEGVAPRLDLPPYEVIAVRFEVRKRAGDVDAADEGLMAGLGYGRGFSQATRTARFCPGGGACDPAFALGVGAGIGAMRTLNEGILVRADCPAPVEPAACATGEALAREAIAAYRRAPFVPGPAPPGPAPADVSNGGD
jgi:hypothetical protein